MNNAAKKFTDVPLDVFLYEFDWWIERAVGCGADGRPNLELNQLELLGEKLAEMLEKVRREYQNRLERAGWQR